MSARGEKIIERGRADLERWIAENVLGAKDAAAMLGVQVPNLKQTGLKPVTRISGGTIPVYLRADVDERRVAREERASRRAAASE
jgi:DNA-binding transcriptional regulator YdaS (Cro superfamily)